MAGTTAATSGHGIGIPHGYHDRSPQGSSQPASSSSSGASSSTQPWRPSRPYGQGTAYDASQVVNVGDRLRAWTNSQAGRNACQITGPNAFCTWNNRNYKVHFIAVKRSDGKVYIDMIAVTGISQRGTVHQIMSNGQLNNSQLQAAANSRDPEIREIGQWLQRINFNNPI